MSPMALFGSGTLRETIAISFQIGMASKAASGSKSNIPLSKSIMDALQTSGLATLEPLLPFVISKPMKNSPTIIRPLMTKSIGRWTVPATALTAQVRSVLFNQSA